MTTDVVEPNSQPTDASEQIDKSKVGQISLRVSTLPAETLAEHSQALGGKIDRHWISFPRLGFLSLNMGSHSATALSAAP